MKIYFYFELGVRRWACAHKSTCLQNPDTSDPLELDLQATVSDLHTVLGS